MSSVLRRLKCLLFGHSDRYSVYDNNIMFRPSSAVNLYTLAYCVECQQLYFKLADKIFTHSPANLPLSSAFSVKIGESEIFRIGIGPSPVTISSLPVTEKRKKN